MPKNKTKSQLESEIFVLNEDNLAMAKKLAEYEGDKPKPQYCVAKEEVLKNAKIVGLFQKNKSLGQYEIIIPINDYENL